MNIYYLISNILDVKSRQRSDRRTSRGNQEEKCTERNEQIRINYRIDSNKFQTRRWTSISSCYRKNFGISIRQSKQGSQSFYWQAWQKGKNFLILSSLFFMPFIVNNLTYFMLLDFSVIGYDLQAFNNIGVYR